MLNTGKCAAVAAVLGVGLAVASMTPASAHYYGYGYRPHHGYGYGYYGFHRPFYRHYGLHRHYRYGFGPY